MTYVVSIVVSLCFLSVGALPVPNPVDSLPLWNEKLHSGLEGA